MDWFRHYHGLCTDPKLHRVARAASVHRSVVIAAWCAVLETASQASSRGSACDLDAHALAFMIDESATVAGRLLAQFAAFGMLTSTGYVAAWSKRQRDSDDAGAKKARQRAAKPMKNKDINTDCPETVPNYRTEQNRTEKESSPVGEPKKVPATAGDAQRHPPKDTQADFARFWAVYPRKVGKDAAEKAFKAAVGRADAETIIAGVERYRKSKPTHQDYCHPSTWLNQGRWQDEENVGQGEGVEVRGITVRKTGENSALLDGVAKLRQRMKADGLDPGVDETSADYPTQGYLLQ